MLRLWSGCCNATRRSFGVAAALVVGAVHSHNVVATTYHDTSPGVLDADDGRGGQVVVAGGEVTTGIDGLASIRVSEAVDGTEGIHGGRINRVTPFCHAGRAGRRVRRRPRAPAGSARPKSVLLSSVSLADHACRQLRKRR